MSKTKLWVALVVVLYGAVELVSLAGLAVLERFRYLGYEPVDRLSERQTQVLEELIAGKTKYVAFSPSLGWAIKPNGASELYRANAQGIRGDREYSVAPAENVRRVTSFGDSFTHCDDVPNDATWQTLIERTDPTTEVINFGVGGYGLDQAYLRYLELGRKYRTDVVLIGFMPENIQRGVNTFRPFYVPETMLPLAKPRFELRDGQLALVPNPMQTLDDYQKLLDRPRETLLALGADDAHFKKRYASTPLDFSPLVRLSRVFIDQLGDRPSADDVIVDGIFNPSSEAYRVTKATIDAFYAAVLAEGAKPVIVVLPNQIHVRQQQKTKKKVYSPLLEAFDSAGYDYVDLMPALENGRVEELFGSLHYSPAGNQLVAEHLLRALDALTRPAPE